VGCERKEPEVVDFWLPPSSNDDNVNFSFIRARKARMSIEQLWRFPPVIQRLNATGRRPLGHGRVGHE